MEKSENLSQIKKPSKEQTIIDKGMHYLKNEPDKWPGFLNNFYTRVIPAENEQITTLRENLQEAGLWHMKHKDYIKELKDHSGLWLNQTPEEFFKTIDKVIEELDTDGKIKTAIRKYCDAKSYDERGVAQDNLEEKLIPVFARLVARGYTMHELRG